MPLVVALTPCGTRLGCRAPALVPSARHGDYDPAPGRTAAEDADPGSQAAGRSHDDAASRPDASAALIRADPDEPAFATVTPLTTTDEVSSTGMWSPFFAVAVETVLRSLK